MEDTIDIFLAYDQADEPLRNALEKHLSTLKRQGFITSWHDQKILPGQEWEQEATLHLRKAHLILLLVSPDFLASDYSYGVEFKRAMERHQRGEATVIPIILRPVDWKHDPLDKLRVLPSGGKPVISWLNQDEGFLSAAEGIREVVEDLRKTDLNRSHAKSTATILDTQLVNSNHVMKDETRQILQTVFHFNEPLTDLSDFFGRKSERMKILDRTYKKGSTSIVGPRRIGKTWIMQYLMLSAPTELGSRFHIAYLDGTSPLCATVNGFVLAALEELHISNSASMSKREGLIHLEEVVKEMKRKNRVPVLCIDEFEGLSNGKVFDLKFFEGLRAIAQAGLVLIIASKYPLIDLVSAPLKTSPFFNIFERLTLKPFALKEAKTFIEMKGNAANFTEQELNLLFQYGQSADQQWLPVKLQLVGGLLLEDKLHAAQDDLDQYRLDDPHYWAVFKEKLEEKYREIGYK